jgi:hypothetical protein
MSLQSERHRNLLVTRLGRLQSIDPSFIDPIWPDARLIDTVLVNAVI